MNQAVVSAQRREIDPLARRRGQWVVCFFQILFVAILLSQIDEPFLSAHNERQNETFDMARHVYHDGWQSVVTPKVSYSWRNAIKQPYTAMLMEVPFHGLIAWPLTRITSHERAVMRLISAALHEALGELLRLTPDELADQRYKRFRALGAFVA